MSANNPGFSVPLGRIKDPNGNMIPLYVGTEWQIFLQGLFSRADGADTERIDSLEIRIELQATAIDDAYVRADEVSGALRALRSKHDIRIKELEFLGAFL